MPNNNVLGDLIEANITDKFEFRDLGIKIGKLYTDMGFPIDMSLNRLDMTKQQKLAVLDGVCQWLIEHKRNSGATEKSIERQRATNFKMVEDFIKTGETGIY